jgi:hypothetical protein
MDARLLCILDGFPGFVDIGFIGTCQPGDDRDLRILLARSRSADFDRNAPDRFQIVRGCRGEPRFDNIHAHARQRPRDFELFRRGHRRARGLFAVPQCCVENLHVV